MCTKFGNNDGIKCELRRELNRKGINSAFLLRQLLLHLLQDYLHISSTSSVIVALPWELLIRFKNSLISAIKFTHNDSEISCFVI